MASLVSPTKLYLELKHLRTAFTNKKEHQTTKTRNLESTVSVAYMYQSFTSNVQWIKITSRNNRNK